MFGGGLSMKNVLVTGADGFVGNALVKSLLDHGYFVYGLDLLDTPKRLDLNSVNFKYLKADLTFDDVFAKFSLHDIDTVYHFAWRGSAGDERKSPDIQLQNALVSADFMKKCQANGVTRFIMAGSIMEFETHSATYDDSLNSSLPYIYGAGKSIAHEIMKPIAKSIGIGLIWTYITNAYGAGEKSPRFINSTIIKLLRGESCEFTSGTQLYDFLYIDDVANAFKLIGEFGKPGNSYMIGSGHAKPLREFISDIFETIDPGSRPQFGGLKYAGPMLPIEVYSIARLAEDCGFKPKVSFKEGILRTASWLKENI